MRRNLAGLLALLAGVATGIGAGVGTLHSEPAEGRLPERWQRGMNLTAFLPGAYGEPPARRAMLTARSIGTERIALVPTWYMQGPTASEVSRDPAKTPTDASLLSAARTARELGLEVALKPHVDVADGSFRGDILPADRKSWFRSYRRMIAGYARLAERIDAEILVVGTELTSMTLETGPWRRIIARVRRLYDGRLTFAANWVEGAETAGFWSELDVIGIDAYMPLRTPTPAPTTAELIEAWGPYVARMQALADRWGLPVLFTELGYESRVGAVAAADGVLGAVSETAQANAYEAAFEALSGEPWFRGIWWWEWSAEGLEPEPGGFSPEGKLAAEVLRAWQGSPLSASARSGGSGSR